MSPDDAGLTDGSKENPMPDGDHFVVESGAMSIIRRHCVGALPHEAYGILLGHRQQDLSLVALPVGQTAEAFRTEDRLALVPAALPVAKTLAGQLGMEYLGVYQADFAGGHGVTSWPIRSLMADRQIPGLDLTLSLWGGEWRLFRDYATDPGPPERRLILTSRRLPEVRQRFNPKRILRRWKEQWPPPQPPLCVYNG